MEEEKPQAVQVVKQSSITLPSVMISLLCAMLIGCAVVANKLTPTEKPSNAALIYDGVKDPNKIGIKIPILGEYISLYEAQQLLAQGEINHHQFQQGLVRQAEDDTYLFQGQWNAQNQAIKTAQETQTAFIAIGTGLASLYFGKNQLKRNGDSSPDEVRAKMAEAENRIWTEAEEYLKSHGLMRPTPV